MEIINQISLIGKTLGKEVLMELVKSRWIKFAIGVAIMSYPLAHLLETLLRAWKM